MKALIPARFLAIFGTVLLMGQALASDLYVGEAKLEEGQDVTPTVLLEALDEVLVRLTGMVDESPVAVLGLGGNDVRMLLQSQQRVRVERLDEDGRQRASLLLRAEFYATAVDQLLARRGLPRWSRERPAILLWIAMDDEQGARLPSDARLEQQVREQARRFGLDVVRPLQDALDLASVQLSDIRGGMIEAAEPGAERYRADVIAMLDLRQEHGDWSGRWSWRLEGADSSISLSGSTVDRVLQGGFQSLLAALVSRYAQTGGGQEAGARRVLVDGVVDSVQYTEVLNYFNSLSLVDSLQVLNADGRQVEFMLVLQGSGLEDLISLSRLLAIERRGADGRLYLRLNR